MNDRDPLVERLGPFANELAAAAEEAEDGEFTDAYAVLAAVARGDSPPADAAQRIVEQAREGQK